MTQKKNNSTSLSIHSKLSNADIQKKAGELYKAAHEAWNFRGIKTIKQALDCPRMKSIARIRKEQGEVCETMLILMVAKTARKFNITKNFEPTQIEEAVQSVFEEYYYLKLSEVYFVLKQGVMGKYGKIYDRFDEQVLMEWFEKYDRERLELVEEQRLVERNSHKEGMSERQLNDWWNDFLKSEHTQKGEFTKRVNEKAYRLATKMRYEEDVLMGSYQLPD